jgi:triacylglycerol lipase
MYFPPQFNRKIAIELGNLIENAYGQYRAFDGQGEWQYPYGYILIKEIKYSTSFVNPFDKDNKLTGYFQKLPFPKGEKPSEIPIGFVLQHKKDIFIIFRGTQTSTEWVNNLNTRFTPFSINNAGYVHGGFFNLYLNIRKEVLDVVPSLPQGAQLYVAGHSLGAIFASLTAYDIEISTGRQIHSLYTFGSPRLGDNDFVNSFNNKLAKRSFRIANSSDIVTEVPFPVAYAGFGGYFNHVETPVIFTIQNKDIEKNHNINTYIAALSETKENLVKALIRNFF